MVLGGGVDGGEFGREALDGALRIHDLARRDAGKIELHRQRLGEQAGIAPGDARAAAGPDLDVDHALGFERSQRIAGDDAADPEAAGQILLGAEEIAGTQFAGEQRIAHLRHDLRRHGGRAEGEDLPFTAVNGGMQPHMASARPSRLKVATILKMISFALGRVKSAAPAAARAQGATFSGRRPGRPHPSA